MLSKHSREQTTDTEQTVQKGDLEGKEGTEAEHNRKMNVRREEVLKK